MIRALRAAGLAAALGAGAPLAAADPPRLEELAHLALTHPDPRFGGLSGIVLEADGRRAAMISDRGVMVTARIDRAGGRITGLSGVAIHQLHDRHGRPLRDFTVDAEGLARAPEGYLISFEGLHRIMLYTAPEAPSRDGPTCPGLRDRLQVNSGLEALARGPDGTVYAIPERSGQWARPFPVYRIRDGACDSRLKIPRRGTYLVTGADIGPDGRLYLLERAFALIGFSTRIRAFTLSGDRLTGEETLIETGYGRYGNMEGIAAWRDGAGAIRLTLVADDNFSVLQSADLVELRLRD